jgi:putative membrane protein
MAPWFPFRSPRKPQSPFAQSHPSFPGTDSAFLNGIASRQSTFPGYHTLTRHKPRRWPLVLRVSKGSVHYEILLPVFLHTLFTTLVVFLDIHWHTLSLMPGTIIPSLSIVVGLMLVFRNGTSYDRFWTGRNCLAAIIASARNLTRCFLVCDRALDSDEASPNERRDTEATVRLLVAILHAVKHHLRTEFAAPVSPVRPGTPACQSRSGTATPVALSGSRPVLSRNASGMLSSSTPLLSHSVSGLLRPGYAGLLASSTQATLEDRGVALPLQLSLSIEAYIRRGVQRSWWAAPQAALLSGTLNGLLSDFARMETIRSTPMPVAHLVHSRQVLALYLMVLPFAMVGEMGWFAVPITAVVAFTLYGIEGIGTQLEDPFGYDKNDIKMDAIVLDAQQELLALLEEWKENGVGFH